MNNQRSTEIKVGLVTLGAILLFIIGISLGRGYSVSVSHQTVLMRFPNSGGIVPSSPVLVNGVKRGSVVSVKNDKGSVLITADIDDIKDLFADATAKLTILEITGGKKIDVFPGKGPAPFDIKNEIQGTTASDLADVVTLVGELGYDAKVLVKRLDTISCAITKILDNDKFVEQLQETIENTNEFIRSANSLLTANRSDIDITLKNLKILISDLKSVVKKYDPKLDTLIHKLDITLDQTKTLLDKSYTTIDNADNLVQDVNQITNDLRYGDGFATKILFDKQYAAKLDSTITSLRQLVEQIQKHGMNTNIRLGTRP